MLAYVLRPGEDIYLIYNMFPNESPEKLLFPQATGCYDIFLAYKDLIDKAAEDKVLHFLKVSHILHFLCATLFHVYTLVITSYNTETL